jgi:hypothetical protein
MLAILSLEQIMRAKTCLIVTLVLSILLLASCNLPSKQTPQSLSTTGPGPSTPAGSPAPVSLCSNPYFPSVLGDTWEYSGNNTFLGAYARTDTVTNSGDNAFAINTDQAGAAYTQIYTCSPQGLLAANPVQQYAGALLSNPDTPLSVEITSNSGLSLPAQIAPGDTWQQTADFKASSQDINVSGRFVFNYSAVGFEQVSVPFAMLNALRLDATIRIEVTGLHILAGTYTTSAWLVAGIGMVKSQGRSNIPGVDFSDALQLTQFTPSP